MMYLLIVYFGNYFEIQNHFIDTVIGKGLDLTLKRSNMSSRTHIGSFVKDFVKSYEERSVTATGYREPLIRIADAADPLFVQLRRYVGPSHQLPEELLSGAKSVICYFIPFEKGIAESNKVGSTPSEIWARAYRETNQLILELNGELAAELKRSNIDSCPIPPTHNYDRTTLLSNWSHKHVAYIAGLGNFGLHHQLITDSGCCGRLGSLVTTLEVEPDARPEKPFCLYKIDRSCDKCVQRCSFGALTSSTLDKRKCHTVCLANERYYSAAVCGKCVSTVPCSFVDPVRIINPSGH